ncbi:(S)-benzoin forming benzil reductase [Virgibacillus byunsanensis]|uniref:(S)-benzoin forming benzil reductase n=1 Tax=Virgibacillus byunsanensis TaxID=570945 RepID=A0ABW3LI41_9BACI
MKYAVITGVSRGLGESIATLFLQSGTHVIGIARSENKQLSQLAEQHNMIYKHYTCDLADTHAIEKTFQAISDDVFREELTTLYLVNNAAVLEPMDQAMNIKSADLAYHMQVNTVAPMVMTNLFMKKVNEKQIPLISVTISSGAAERPVYGWSAYCSSKASINMYTKTVALEQEELNTGTKVIAFSPGVMNTVMQEKIRASSHEEFIEVDKFKAYKKNDLLKSTDTVGRILVDIMTDETGLINGKIYNVKDYI